MSDEKKSPIEYLILFLIVTTIGFGAGLFLANFIFLQWQKIPMEYYSYKVIFDYKAAYGNVPAVAKAIKISLSLILIIPVLLNLIVLIALFSKPKREQHGSARFANKIDIKKSGLIQNTKRTRDTEEKNTLKSLSVSR